MEEVKETIETQVENNDVQQSQQTSAPHENLATTNLVAMRKKLEAEELARKDAEKRVVEIERKFQSYSPATSQEPTDSEDFGDPEDVVVNKQFASTTKKLNLKFSESDQKIAALEQKLSYFEAKSELDSIKDFNEVVTDENLRTFARLYPDDYETVMTNPNLRLRSKTAYNMIKNYGISQNSVRQGEILKSYDKKIEANKAKPGSSASAPVSGSPLTKYGRYEEDGRLVMTEEDAKQVHKDMRRKLGFE
jgi:hypothetical protein